MSSKGIYGISGSGLDIDSMVKMGMATKQSEYDKMYKKEVQKEWEKEAYATLYTDMTKFNSITLYDYKMESTTNKKTATSSDAAAVSVSANGAAAAMNHKVVVNSMATNAYLMTTDTIERQNTSESDSIYLKDLLFGSLTDNGDGTYTVGRSEKFQVADGFSFNGEEYTGISFNDADKKYTLTKADGTTADISEEDFKNGTFKFGDKEVTGEDVTVNTDDSGKGTSFTAVTSKESVDKDATAFEFRLSDGKAFSTVKYTYAELLEDGGRSIYDLVSDATKDLNITGRYDSATDSVSFYNKDGGSANKIMFTALDDNAAALLNNLKLGSTDGTTLSPAIAFEKDKADGAAGENGSITVDGKTYNNLTGNKLTVDGVSYTFNEVTTKPVSVTVTQDTEAIIDTVKKFVEDYNKMLDDLTAKYKEEKFSDYQPLTDEEKKDMSEEQIKKWEEKAKSGLLNHSSILSSLMSEMRESIYTPVSSIDSKYNSAYSIGISSSNSSGHLTLDEDKLKKALGEDQNCVYNVLSTYEEEKKYNPATGEYETTGKNDFKGTGLAWRLSDVMSKGLSSVKSYAGTSAITEDDSSLGKLIVQQKEKMANFKKLMDAFEDKLYKQYDNLEVSIQQLSTQLAMITGGGQ